jgi:hypothetical protein
VATIVREGGGKVVSYEGFSSVDGLDVAIKAWVACDDSC